MTVHEHGNYLRYLHDHCRCEPCTRAWVTYQHKLELRRARGQVWADPDGPHRAVVADLIDRWGLSFFAFRDLGSGENTARKIYHGHPHVSASVADHIADVTIDDFTDRRLVHGHHAQQYVDRMTGDHGMTITDVSRALGWQTTGFPPVGAKATLGLVRRLRAIVADLERPRCARCGRDPMPGGAELCGTCFTASTMPSPRELDDVARREQEAARRRKARALARKEVAA